MKVIVTGGTGFIGSHLVNRLLEAGHSVSVPVRKESNTEWLSHQGVKKVTIDLTDIEKVKKLLEDIDIVFHLASIRGSGWAYDDTLIWDTNVRITDNLLRASVDGSKHFIYVSSVSVHGHLNGKTADEEYPYRPVTMYGRSKQESEKLVSKYHKADGLNTTVIRPVITYGPHDTWGMIPKLIRLIDSDRYLTVGSGRNRVHLIYIDDLIDGLVLTMNRPGCFGEAFILAGERPITINSLVRIVEKTLNKSVPKLHVPLPFAKTAAFFMEFVSKRVLKSKEPVVTRDKVDIMTVDRAYDISKAKEVLGFTPEIDYEDGLERTVSWLNAAGVNR